MTEPLPNPVPAATDPAPTPAEPSLESRPQNESTQAAPARPTGRRHPWHFPVFWLAVAAIALAAWQWTETRHRLLTTQEEVARRLVGQDAQARDTLTQARQAQELAQALQTRLGVVESKLAESQSQQAALEGLYQELARGRDEWTLAEVEQMIGLAAQQLQVAGNVQAAVLALSNADARLARAERPQFLVLRKMIARDLARLRALPAVDVAGISARLETVMAATDTLALAFEVRPRVADSQPPAAKAPASAPAAGFSLAAFDAWWPHLAGDFWREIRGLVRIERFDRPEPVLLAPTHAFFLRENLKLRLLNARLALLARDQATFRGDTQQAVVWLERHFEPRDKSVQAALATLQPLLKADLGLEIPNLNDSLSALRTVRLGRGGRDGAP